MPEYTSDNTLRIAKRFHNTKRTYLLVNPLQAKHIPVSPTRALAMMGALGERLAAEYPAARLVVGFAETATAIGAAVAGRLGPECVCLQTTRESFPAAGSWVEFLEEHSHAVEQKLRGDTLSQLLAGTDTVILVDDEISTGKTILNMCREWKRQCPALAGKKIVAASLLNRLSPEHETRLAREGIESRCLVKLPQADYAALVEGVEIREAEGAVPLPLRLRSARLPGGRLPDPRLGVRIGEYQACCAQLAGVLKGDFLGELRPGSRILTLGTEECMYPALAVGAALERDERGFQVYCHATTRSPIGICTRPEYPIFSGSRLESFYEKGRTTYLYDTADYDAIIVLSDTPIEGTEALCSLLGAFPPRSDRQIFYVQGGQHVWYL